MQEFYTGMLLGKNTLYIPRNATAHLPDNEIFIRNFDHGSMELILLGTARGMRNVANRLLNDAERINPKCDPAKIYRWVSMGMEWERRIDLGYWLNGKRVVVETYLHLPEKHLSKFKPEESPSYIKFVPEKDCLVAMKSSDLSAYFSARANYYAQKGEEVDSSPEESADASPEDGTHRKAS